MKIKMSKQSLDFIEKELDNDEAQDFLDKLKSMIDDGSFFENSKPLDMEVLKREEPEVYAEFIKAIEETDNITMQ